jgi:hypothetical protein
LNIRFQTVTKEVKIPKNYQKEAIRTRKKNGF